jgi:hypothetical protein
MSEVAQRAQCVCSRISEHSLDLFVGCLKLQSKQFSPDDSPFHEQKHLNRKLSSFGSTNRLSR